MGKLIAWEAEDIQAITRQLDVHTNLAEYSKARLHFEASLTTDATCPLYPHGNWLTIGKFYLGIQGLQKSDKTV